MASSPAVLFVCLGNICRSPLAEAAFRAETARLGLEIRIDSAGTGDWHVGHAPDQRAQAIARRHGIDIAHYRARQVVAHDFLHFTHIVAMDGDNLQNLERLRPANATAKVALLLDHVDGRTGTSVADPYYGAAEDFERTWSDVCAGAAALARTLMR